MIVAVLICLVEVVGVVIGDLRGLLRRRFWGVDDLERRDGEDGERIVGAVGGDLNCENYYIGGAVVVVMVASMEPLLHYNYN